MSDPYPTGGNMAQPGDWPGGVNPQQPVTQAEAQQVVGEQLQAAAGPPPTDAGASLEQMQAQQREVLLPMEQQIQDMMEAFKAQQDKQTQQIEDLQRQLAGAKAAAGPPAVEQYANGVAALVKAHADANPDVPREQFAPALEAAGKLREAATAAVTSRDTGDVVSLAGQIEKWAARGVGKHVDFSSLRADLDLLAEAAVRLAA